MGRTAGLKLAATPTRLPTDDQVIELLTAAADVGVNLIDTAPAYGVSESRLGQLLTRVRPREAWVICTKAGEMFEEASGQSRYDFSRGAIVASIEQSLTRLATDRVEIALLHFSGSTDDVGVLKQGEALGAISELKRAGKVRAIGASVGSVAGGWAALEAGCDVVMLTLNAHEQSMAPVAAAAGQQGVGVLVKKALAGGRLSAGITVDNAGGELGAESGGDSLRWVLSQPGVACAVVGTTRAAHLRANMASLRTH